MKILFAIQGTGNGHLSRARDVYPELCTYGSVDVLISGIQADVTVSFPVKYRLYGMSFIFGKKGGVSFWRTLRSLNLFQLLRDVYRIPVEDYDLVVNDFEPVTAWACKLRKVPCVGLSHQSAVLHPAAPRPQKGDWLGAWVLRYYAPVNTAFGFHFAAYGTHVFTPVIRREVRALRPEKGRHYTVYLPAYDDKFLVDYLSRFPQVQWQVFSRHSKQSYAAANVTIHPIDNVAFLNSMAMAAGVLCGAGFEGPAEALFLGKKLIVVPMHLQYEQQCNAAALQSLGVPVVPHLDQEHYDLIAAWIGEGTVVMVNFPDCTAEVVAIMMQTVSRSSSPGYFSASGIAGAVREF